MNKNQLALLIVIFLISISCGCSPRLYSESRDVMGTIVEVTSVYPEAADIVFNEMNRIDNLCSLYKKGSAIAHLNKNGILNTNFEVAHLLKQAIYFYYVTDGAFDVTVGPVAQLWREKLGEGVVPSRSEIQNALRLIGSDKIRIDDKNNTVKLQRKNMVIDLGGIAKGYAIDAAVKELKRRSIDSAIINVGGDLYCLGKKSRRPWQVGVRHPREPEKVFTTLALTDRAAATSGDYEQFVEVDGKRYSHILNPKTGAPVNNGIISVTVVAREALIADIAATSIFVMGQEKGYKLFSNFPGIDKIIIITESDVSDN